MLQQSRRVESNLVAHIAEVDARRLHARFSAPSMFRYAVEILHLSEAEAYLRIAVARASREHPVLLEMLGDGRLHLSGIALLAKHLTESTRDAVLARAVHKTKREIEELVAELAPRPDVPSSIRKRRMRPARVAPSGNPAVATKPTPAPTESPALPSSPQTSLLGPDKVEPSPREPKPAVEPLAKAKYRVTFTADAALRDKLKRLEALMDSDLAEAIDAAVTQKLERLEAARFGKTKTPRTAVEDTETALLQSRSRYIPAAIRWAVCERDDNRCTFVDASGRRCSERHRLEFHHDAPYGKGGAHSVENVRLVCRLHNVFLAEQEYGANVMSAFRQSSGGRVSEPAPDYFVRAELGATRVEVRPAGRLDPLSGPERSTQGSP